jgi:hypothetical protein
MASSMTGTQGQRGVFGAAVYWLGDAEDPPASAFESEVDPSEGAVEEGWAVDDVSNGMTASGGMVSDPSGGPEEDEHPAGSASARDRPATAMRRCVLWRFVVFSFAYSPVGVSRRPGAVAR